MASLPYTESQLAKLLILGEKSLAIITARENMSPRAVHALDKDIFAVGFTMFQRVLPDNYAKALANLITTYGVGQG
jgi:hypothetical protein